MNKREFRILITENCNAKCPNCFNKDYREDKYISLDNLEDIYKYLASNGVEKIKIMGGEPTVHPNFEKAIEKAQKYFKKIIIFTNALNDKILNIEPREQDSIIYNFNFVTERFNDKKLLLDKKGIRSFEIQVCFNADITKYKLALLRMKKYMTGIKKINIYLTLDCTDNIFLHRKEIIAKWNELTEFIRNELNVEPYQDHIIPRCFYENTEMDVRKLDNKCNVLCSGLIDSSMKLRYCNQHPVILGDFDTKQDFSKVLGLLADEYNKMMEEAKKCRNCKRFMISCNGGCFKDIMKGCKACL